MARIPTARDPVDPSALGVTLMHEHIFVLDTEVMQNYPAEWGSEDRRVDDAIARMNELKARGVDTIVDLTVTGLGRDIPRIQRVASKTTLNILVATGIYTYNELPFYFQFHKPERLAETFIHDIEQGIADTGVRAAILKCATDSPGLTPGVERALRATAMAHRQTGVPISTHTNARRKNGLDQQRIFKEEGVDLTRVIIGHSGDSTNLDYLEELIANGSYIGMDRFGIDSFCSFEDRVATVATLCERGHSNRMVLSHDAACFNHWFPEGAMEQAMPHWNYLHIHNDVIPALDQKGVTPEQIHIMLVDNPRRIFETQGGAAALVR